MGSGGLSLHTPSGPSETTQVMALGDISESHQPSSLPEAEARPPIKHSTLPLKTQGKQVRRKEGGREGGKGMSSTAITPCGPSPEGPLSFLAAHHPCIHPAPQPAFCHALLFEITHTHLR